MHVKDRKHILKYYKDKISSEYFEDTGRKYAQNLNQMFQDAVKQIAC